MIEIEENLLIPSHYAGERLDKVLAELLPQYSRQSLQNWLLQGAILINGQTASKKMTVQGLEQVTLSARQEAQGNWQAQAMALDVVFADAAFIIVNKPKDLVVHPAAGNPDGTLVNALLHHFPELQNLPRAGIVHRLDKDTTGLLVVARTLTAHTDLVRQLQARTVRRQYQALVNGVLTAGGTVDAPIGRHPIQRKKMAVVAQGKPAVTHYRILQKFQKHSLLRVQLESGRTHQIRVHMAHLGHPIVGDQTYGARLQLPKGCSEEDRVLLANFTRQALHAEQLTLTHPQSGESCHFTAPLPEDMAQLIQALALWYT